MYFPQRMGCYPKSGFEYYCAFLLGVDHRKNSPLEISNTMAVKRKLSAAVPNETRKKAPKVGARSDKSSRSIQKPSKRPIIKETDSFGEEDEFKGFEDDGDQTDEDELNLEEESPRNFQGDDLDDEEEEMEEDEAVGDSKSSKQAKSSSTSGTAPRIRAITQS